MPERSVTASPATETPAHDGSPINTTIGLQDGGVYGVGMPVVVDFSEPVPDQAKPGVEQRLSVQSRPTQTGAWRWNGDREVIYRPKDFWLPGTKVTVNTALGGLLVSGGYLDTNRHVSVAIGRK